MTLLLSPVTSFRGNRTFLEALPECDVCHDVLLVPQATPGACAGLYDRGRKVVQASAQYRSSPHPQMLGDATTALDALNYPWAPTEFDYVYLGQVTGHFGHFIMSSMARLWDIRFAHNPRTRFVIPNHESIAHLWSHPHIAAIFGAVGLTQANVIGVQGPTRFAVITVPSPAIEEQNFVHAVFGPLCAAIGRLVTVHVPQAPCDRPVYLSKARLRRGVLTVTNEAEMEERLHDLGVDVVHPETLSFAAQVVLFRDRPVVAGITGSALHTSVFAPPGEMVALSLDKTILSNQALLDLASGWRSSTVWLGADAVREENVSGFAHTFKLADPAQAATGIVDLIHAAMERRRGAGQVAVAA